MSSLFGKGTFRGFGPSRFRASDRPPATQWVTAARGQLLRRAVRARCPRQPGVYGMIGQYGDLIYVGKAKCLRTRLSSYFRPKSRDPKAARIIQVTSALVWECLPSEFAALLRELELIHRWRPRFNVQGKPGRYRRTYVCVGRAPAPYVFLTRRPGPKVLASYGPVPVGRQAREAVRRLNDWFQLRDCSQSQSMRFADQGELFPVIRAAGCLRYEIQTCLGPCTGACCQSAYAGQVQAVRAFLDGSDSSLLDTLRRQMATAAAGQMFEQAANLRDRWRVVGWLRDQIQRIQAAQVDNAFIYPVKSFTKSSVWYLIHHGQVRAVMPEPRTDPVRRRLWSAIENMLEPGSWTRPAAEEDVDVLLLVAAWFRKHPEERSRTITPEALREVLAAGNVAQASLG